MAAGWTYNGSGFDFALARYNPDGSLNNSFNHDGKLTTDFGGSGSASSLAVQDDGKVVAAGYTSSSVSWDFAGANVAWVAPRSSTRGKAEVWLDGKKVATVDLFSSTVLSRKVVYAANGLDPTVNHTLEIKALGTGGRPRVDVDAFVVLC